MSSKVWIRVAWPEYGYACPLFIREVIPRGIESARTVGVHDAFHRDSTRTCPAGRASSLEESARRYNFDLAMDGAMNQPECLTPEVERADQLVRVERDAGHRLRC